MKTKTLSHREAALIAHAKRKAIQEFKVRSIVQINCDNWPIHSYGWPFKPQQAVIKLTLAEIEAFNQFHGLRQPDTFIVN